MTSSNQPSLETRESLLRPLRLKGVIQRYSWGKVGSASRVAAMVQGEVPEGPLAEFWLGGHPKGCSLVETSPGEWLPLTELSKRQPRLFGAVPYPQALPFLLKILSVDSTWGLSIQAHPDLDLAGKLHVLDPGNYPDSFHKPEVGVALSPVTLLYGFRSPGDLRNTLSRFPEIKKILGPQVVGEIAGSGAGSELVSLRRPALEALLRAPSAQVEEAVLSVSARFKGQEELPREVELLERLRKRYGNGDVGLLALFILNVVDIPPGKAIFIAPNVPHAYLDGDLVECMACSDNVVRAGLTSKFKDVETLLKMLNYSVERPSLVEPRAGETEFLDVPVPVQEFSLRILALGSGTVEFQPEQGKAEMLLCLGRSASIRLLAGGDTLLLKDGESVLLPAGVASCLIERAEAAIYRVTSGHVVSL